MAAYNARKPFGGRVSARTPLGELTDPLAGGDGLASSSPKTPPL